MTRLVTFGETMIRLSPPEGQRLSRVERFDAHVGGAESNVAVAASNLGVESAWLSALPDTALGDRIAHALRGEGVEPLVSWTNDGRVGTYYFERGGQPRGQTVVYDRKGTPIRDITPDDLPLDRVREADLFFVSGITPALSERVARTTARLLETAADAGVRTAFDVNYRSKLWDPDDARETLTGLFANLDVLFVAERDAQTVLGYDSDAEAIARDLGASHEFETVVVTRGSKGAVAVHDETLHEQSAFETDTVDAVGSGDAFVGGYLAHRLSTASVSEALEYGAATAALKRTIEGDMARLTTDEVSSLVDTEDTRHIDR